MSESLTESQPASRWAQLTAGWHSLPARLQDERPHSFRAVSVGLALIGYAVPLLFPIATLALSFHVVTGLLQGAFQDQFVNIALLAFCATLTVSLWRLRVGEPEGEPLSRQQVPALYDLVDEIRTAFQAPRITDIHLSEYAHLTMHRVPRTGYPFLFRHTLVAGLPTLQCMSTDQFKCLLAASIGELSPVRADTAGWIMQLARTWQQYRIAVAGRWTPAAILYRVFLAGYAPLMNAFAARLRGAHRLRADRYALEIASDDLVVEMIAADVVMARFLKDQYWPTVYRAAEHSATPNFKVFRNLEAVFRRIVSHDDIQVWIRESFVGKWQSDDNDPGLKTRLREVGHSDINYRRPEEPSAAHTLLGATYQWIIDRCDARWAEEHQADWAARHAKTRRQYDRLDMLRKVLSQHGLRGDEAMEYAALVKRYGTPQEAAEAYDTILELNPNDARINFGVGKFMLAHRDARGVKVLEHAMKLDKRFVDPACRLISGFVTQHKLQDTVRKYVASDDKGGSKGKRSVA